MLWIGLTGGIASGKSTVAKMIQKSGLVVVDADEIAHEIVAKGTEGLSAVIKTFGEKMLQADGSLNRKALGAIIFSDPKKRQLLESITHPLIKAEVQKRKGQLQQQGVNLAFYDVPLLFEKKLEKEFDKIVVVTILPNLQQERMSQRDQLSSQQIAKRLESQLPLSEKEKLADFVLINNGSLPELEIQVKQLLIKLKGAITSSEKKP